MTATSDDIGPDEEMDLDGGTVLSPTEGSTALVVPLTAEQLADLERVASETGSTAIEVAQHLVEDAARRGGSFGA